MGFWLMMLACDLAIPLMMAVAGWLYLKRPPAFSSRARWGYRTSMSMKNRETWAFAHAFSGKLWLIGGCALLPLTLAALWFVRDGGAQTVSLTSCWVLLIQAVPFAGAFVPTELALRRAFDRHGFRK